MTDAVLASAANRNWVKVPPARGGRKWRHDEDDRLFPAPRADALRAAAASAPAAGAGARPGAAAGAAARRSPPLEETGFQPIFDGKSLKGWDCDPDFWRVEGEAIVGETARRASAEAEHLLHLARRLARRFRAEAAVQAHRRGYGNSGIQYRSVELPDVARWVMKGYQADIDAQQRYTGQIYEERGRGFLALRGQIQLYRRRQEAGSIGSLGDGDELKKLIKVDDWNDIHIIARGNTIIQLINGHVMSQLIDDDKAGRKMAGLIGIQLHMTAGRR